MKKLNLIILTILFVNSFVVYGLEKKSKYEDVSKVIDVWIESEKDYQDIPFISGVVVKDQKVLWSGAFGQAKIGLAVLGNENTSSSICSTTKVFTATAIMKLIDEGKINLDDKVKDILPKFTVIEKLPAGGDVTIRSLLNHTSGLPRDTNHGYWGAPDHAFPTEDELFESLAIQETERRVGSDMSYSNIGYALLGLIIEKISGASYKNYVESNIFKPLQMSNSVVELPSSLYGKEHAIGYSAINRDGKRKPANFYQTNAMQSAAGISSTALDLAKFAMWQFRLADSSKAEIIQPTSLKSMYKAQGISKGGVEYDRGFGYEVYKDNKGSNWAIHGGVCPGYVSFLKMDVTKKKAYAFLVNANRGNVFKYASHLATIIDRAQQIPNVENNDVDLSQYTGFFNVNPWNSEYYVGKWGNGLVLLYLPVQSLKHSMNHYQHVEGDTFQLIENGELTDEKIHFFRDKQGRVIKVENGGNLHPKITYADI